MSIKPLPVRCPSHRGTKMTYSCGTNLSTSARGADLPQRKDLGTLQHHVAWMLKLGQTGNVRTPTESTTIAATDDCLWHWVYHTYGFWHFCLPFVYYSTYVLLCPSSIPHSARYRRPRIGQAAKDMSIKLASKEAR